MNVKEDGVSLLIMCVGDCICVPFQPEWFPMLSLLHLSLFFARFHRFRRLPLSSCMTGAQCNQVQTNLSAFLHFFSSVLYVRSLRSVSLSQFAPVFKHECSLKVGFAYGLDGKQFLWQRLKEHDALCDMREFRRVLQPFCVKKYHYPFLSTVEVHPLTLGVQPPTIVQSTWPHH